jgi:hypothetical protein
MVTNTEATHFVHYYDNRIYVREADQFQKQGGLTEAWGKDWIPVIARTKRGARIQAVKLFLGKDKICY